ncbi:MAG TPA: hypothetical protein VGM17_02205 [Rhizomicrobium sp.]|jgi:hypothetical protein
MAETNSDNMRSLSQRAYAFATNGGGAITYRLVLVAAATILLALVRWIGNEQTATLRSIDSRLQHVEQSLPSYDVRILGNAQAIQQERDDQTRLWSSETDHEHRITVLESRLPPR